MRFLLLFLLFPVLLFSQPSSLTQGTWTGPYGQRVKYVYLPAGYDGQSTWPVIWGWQGNGERNNTTLITSSGQPKAMAAGVQCKCIMIVYQLGQSTQENNNGFTNSTEPMWNDLLANYKVDLNRVVLNGLSLGAIGLRAFVDANPNRVAGYIAISGAYSTSTASMAAIANIPAYYIHNGNDVTQGISTGAAAVDSISKRGPAVYPLTDYSQSGGHGSWNEKVYNVFDKWTSWSLMQDKRPDSMALRYVDSAVSSGLESDYWRALRLVNSLTSSTHKTNQLSRLSTLLGTIRGVGARVWMLDPGTAAYPTSGGNSTKMTNGASGTTYANLTQIDGTASTVGFTINTAFNSSLYSTDGLTGSYFNGLHPNAYQDAFTVFGTGGRFTFTGLNNAKTYTIRFYAVLKSFSNSYESGLRVTIPATGGVQKGMGLIFYNTNKYIEFTGLSPASGNITGATSNYVTNGESRVTAIQLIEEGTPGTPNPPPVVSTGGDQSIPNATTSASLVSTATAGSGTTITSRLWTLISGSGVITTPTTANTTVTNLGVGANRFRMTATQSDGQTDYDETIITRADTSITPTAKDVSRPFTFTGPPKIGYNGGFYPNNAFTTFGEKQQSLAAYLVSGKGPFRTSLFANFIGPGGYAPDYELPRFKYMVDTLGMDKPTVFVGILASQPYIYQEDSTYPGAPYQSRAFKNMYEPIFLPDGSVNPDNYMAVYIKTICDVYGNYVGVLGLVNEPDIPFGSTSAWDNAMPTPGSLANWQAPFPRYIRGLQILWEVTQKYRPDIPVTVGGVGFYEYLRCLGKYTANPVDGSVTAEWPHTGLAYISTIDWHLYPMYHFFNYNPFPTQKWHHNSDYYAKYAGVKKDSIEANLKAFGYNGVTYPRKPHIISEINLPRVPWGVNIGSFNQINFNDSLQSNWLIKQFVQGMKDTIQMTNLYLIAEQANVPPDNKTDELSLYFFMAPYANGNAAGLSVSTLVKLKQFYTHKTIDSLLGGWYYDAARTTAMNLAGNIEGAAFKLGNQYRYIIWASTYNNDSTETASGTYSFPSEFGMSNVYKYNWQWSKGDKPRVKGSSQSIALTGEPMFITEAPNDLEEPIFLGVRDRGATFELKIHPLNRTLLTNGRAAVLGSSTTAGTGASSYLNSVIPKLQTKFGNGLLFYNMSVGGQTGMEAQPTPDGILSRNANTAASADPTFVLLAFPNNSVGSGVADSTFINAMVKQYNYFRGKGIPVFVTGAQPRTSYGASLQNRLIAINNELLARIPNAYMNDFGWKLVDSSFTKPFNIKPVLNSGDDIHYNDSGVVIMVNNHFHDIDSIFFNRATIYSAYEIQYSAGGGWLPFDYITDCSITSKQYSRLGSGTYQFRMRARKVEDDTWTNWSDTAVLSQPYQRNTFVQSIKVNLGLTADADAPAPWNEVHTASGSTTPGVTFNLLDSLGGYGGKFTVTKAFSTIGGTGVAGTGYPLSVTLSGWQNSATANTDVAEFTITGLTPGAYQFEGVGSKNNTTNYNRIVGVDFNGGFGGAPIHTGTAASMQPFYVYSFVGADSTATVRVQSVGDLSQLTAFTLRRFENIIQPYVGGLRYNRRRVVRWRSY